MVQYRTTVLVFIHWVIGYSTVRREVQYSAAHVIVITYLPTVPTYGTTVQYCSIVDIIDDSTVLVLCTVQYRTVLYCSL